MLELIIKYFTIPNQYNDEEIILRIVYSPYHIDLEKNQIKSSAFQPPPNRVDVSVLRINYTTADFCKQHGQRFAIPSKKYYQGFGAFKVADLNEIRSEDDTEPRIVVSKIFEPRKRLFLPMHGDIIMGKLENGVPPSNQMKRRAKKIKKIVTLFRDPNPDSKKWKGDEIKI